MDGAGSPPRSVLFLCTHNQIRSPMAAALTALRFGSLMRIDSAGIRPHDEPDYLAQAVMDEMGADLSAHKAKGLDAFEELEDGPFDLIVSLSPEAHHNAVNMVPNVGLAAEYWPTFDPSLSEGSRDQRLMEYRTVRDGLDKRIAERFPRPSTG
jgi:protein-tyrosine-phosphatase